MSDFNFLSDAFREKMASLPRETRNEFEKTLQSALDVPNLRTVQLWTRYGSQQRNFMNRSLSAEQLTKRMTIVALVLRGGIISSAPTKSTTFSPRETPREKGKKLSSYLEDSFTASQGWSIEFSDNDTTFTYFYFLDSPEPAEETGAGELTPEEIEEVWGDIA